VFGLANGRSILSVGRQKCLWSVEGFRLTRQAKIRKLLDWQQQENNE